MGQGSRGAMQLGPGLSPLQPLREDMVFVRGFFNEQAVLHKSVHLGRSPNLLSGAWVSTDQSDIRVGRTMDQLLAQRIGDRTAVPSLVLGIEPTELRLEDGLSMLYGSCISWASETKPATKEIYPSRVFDLLVGDGEGRRLDRSILDQVLADARDLRRKVSATTAANSTSISIRSAMSNTGSIGPRSRAMKASDRYRSACFPRPGEQLPQDIPRTCG